MNIHPKQKPGGAFAANRYHSEVGGGCYDCYEPFSGSGSHLIAAEILGRACYAMEQEPQYVDVAINPADSQVQEGVPGPTGFLPLTMTIS